MEMPASEDFLISKAHELLNLNAQQYEIIQKMFRIFEELDGMKTNVKIRDFYSKLEESTVALAQFYDMVNVYGEYIFDLAKIYSLKTPPILP